MRIHRRMSPALLTLASKNPQTPAHVCDGAYTEDEGGTSLTLPGCDRLCLHQRTHWYYGQHHRASSTRAGATSGLRNAAG
jgi:hypothetical protein